MTVPTTTDADEIGRRLDALVIADPIRNTLFGSIRAYLRHTRTGGWCAHSGVALAARSSPTHPVAVGEGWTNVRPLADALGGLPSLAGLGGPVRTIDVLIELLGRAPTHRTAERLYRLGRVHEPVGVAGRARLAGLPDIDLLTEWYTAFSLEAHLGVPAGFDARAPVARSVAERGVWIWAGPEGTPVSMATRRAPAAGVSRIGPVYTPPAQRGHGYGSAVTARAAFDTLDRAAVPVLYTDLANPTSNKIYQAIGFRPVVDRASVTFA
jgi:GNAT superfamily N-acetyltransferase